MNQSLSFVSTVELVQLKLFLNFSIQSYKNRYNLIDLEHKKYYVCFKTFDQTDLTLSYQCGSQENKDKNDCKTTTHNGRILY